MDGNEALTSEKYVVGMSFLFMLLFVSVFVGSGFWIGRRYERRVWNKRLPRAMDQLCEECHDVGLTSGYEVGYKKGLATCDDVLDKEDGRY